MGYDLVLPVTRGCLTEVFFSSETWNAVVRHTDHRSSGSGFGCTQPRTFKKTCLTLSRPARAGSAEPSLVAPSHSYPLYPEKKTSFAVESSFRMIPNRSRSSLRKCNPKTSGACCESVQRPARTDKKKLLFPFDRRPPFGRHAGISASQTFLMVGDVHHIQSLCSTLVLYFNLFC
jgi:hypothetical protein